MRTDFKEGDRVVVKFHPYADLIGTSGVIVHIYDESNLLVKHDVLHEKLHDGGGCVPDHSGWWYEPQMLINDRFNAICIEEVL